MRRIKAFERIEMVNGKEKPTCVCLQENKRCRRWCDKVELTEDEYQDAKYCFEHNGEVRLK